MWATWLWLVFIFKGDNSIDLFQETVKTLILGFSLRLFKWIFSKLCKVITPVDVHTFILVLVTLAECQGHNGVENRKQSCVSLTDKFWSIWLQTLSDCYRHGHDQAHKGFKTNFDACLREIIDVLMCCCLDKKMLMLGVSRTLFKRDLWNCAW